MAVLLVGNDPASEIYVSRKLKRAKEREIVTELIRFHNRSSIESIENKIRELNNDSLIGGIMVQLPLPLELRTHTREILDTINPTKDVDGLTSTSMELLASGKPKFYSAAVVAVLSIMEEQLGKKLLYNEAEKNLSGLNCTVVGYSDLVGKPLSIVLKNSGANVSVCDINTPKEEVIKKCQQADILVSATGAAKLIKKEMVKAGAIVIDVGISRDENGRLSGDVDFEEVTKIAKFVTPVPGGVGPRTVEALLDNFETRS